MANGYTVFFTYMLATSGSTNDGSGYSDAIHCNYVNSLYLDNIINKEVNIHFDDIDDFKFLNGFDTTGNTGTGFSANRICIIVQLINNANYASLSDVKPFANAWKLFDVTDQIVDFNPTFEIGRQIPAEYMVSTIFKVPLYLYENIQYAIPYNLEYLNYPKHPVNTIVETDANSPLCFGDEEYFFGNVSADVEAIAYSSDLAINLPLNQFNSSTNNTWDGGDVYISEIGLYDDSNNLVAIAKLNDPVPKNSTITRTIVFGMDF